MAQLSGHILADGAQIDASNRSVTCFMQLTLSAAAILGDASVGLNKC